MKSVMKIILVVVFLLSGELLTAQYCTSGGPSTDSDGNVQLVNITGNGSTAISHTSSCPGYIGVEDLTVQSVDLSAGNTYTLNVTFGTCDNNNSSAGEVWIDFNEDHDFSDTGESIGQSSGTPGTAPWDAPVAFTFTVPSDAANGPSRMRIMQKDWGSLPLNACASFYTGSVMDFGVVISGGQSICNMPSNQDETGITTTAATLNWNEDGSATSWDVEYGIEGFSQGQGTTVNVSTTPSTNLSSLSSGTYYSWYVRSICSGGGKSNWEGPHTFMTSCAPQTAPFSENFDAVSTPALPNCWSKKVVQSDPMFFGVTVETQNGDAQSNPNCVLMDAGDDWAATLLLITPQLSDLTTQSNQIRFYAKTWNSIDVIVGTMSDPTDETTFTAFQTISPTDSYAEYTVLFDVNYTLTDDYIAFKHSGADHTQLTIDNFVYEAIPTCPTPSGQTESNITSTSVDLNWTENGTSSTWDIQYGPSGFTQGTGTTVTASAKPYNVTGLSIGTTYDWYVRSDCGGGDQSTWLGPSTFTTNCAALTATYNQNFDQVTMPDLPNCWSVKIVQGASAFVGTTTGDNPNSAPNHAYIYNGSATAGNILLISPQFSDLNSQSNQIRFYSKANQLPTDIVVGTMSDPTDESTFTAFRTVAITGDYAEYSVIFGATYNLTDEYIAFRHGLNSTQTYIYIDDFVYEPAPTCPPPAVQVVSNITLNSADLSWIENGTATSWNIQYGTKNFTLGSGTTISGVTNPYTLSGLLANGEYDWYVQTDCGGGSQSSWTGPSYFQTLSGDAQNPSPENAIAHIAITATNLNWDDVVNADSYTIDIGTTYGGNDIVSAAACATSEYTYSTTWDYLTKYYWTVKTVYNGGAATTAGVVWNFTTECMPKSVPYNENFDAVTAPDIPECWNTVVNYTSSSAFIITRTGGEPTPSTNYVDMYNNGAPSPTILLVTPRLADLTTQSNQIRFYAFSSQHTVDLVVGTMSDPNDASTFVPYDTIVYDGSNNSNWEEYTIMFGSAYTLSNEFIAFRHSGTTWCSIFFDHFVYESMPACPTPNFLSESAITLNSADLAWEANGTSTWNIKYGTTGFDPATQGTTVSGITANPYTLGNTLTPNTNYDWYVQADCGSGTTSAWSEVSSFTTSDGKAVNPSPTSNASNIALNATTLNWDDVPHAQSYLLNIGTSSGASNIVSNASVASSSYIYTTNWDYGTTYYWTVTTVHSGGQHVVGNEWGFETTTGTHLLPVTEDFEGGLDKFDNAFDNGTDWITTTAFYHTGNKSVYNSYDNGETNILLETGVFDLTATNSPTLSFWQIAKTEGDYDQCFVEISTDGGQTYTILPAGAYTGSALDYSAKQYFHEDSYSTWGTNDDPPQNNWWKEESFNLDGYKTTNVRIRFRLFSDSGVKRNGWYIDDVEIDQQQSCSSPTAQSNSNLSDSDVDLSWTENGAATEWTIEYGEPGFQIGTGTRISVTSNPYNLTGLNSSTDYSWYVRSKCSNGSYTNWVGVDNFTTLLSPNIVSSFPYSESFESGLGDWEQMNSEEMDWTRQTGTTPSANTGPSSASNGNYYLFTEASGHTSDRAGLILAFDFTSLTDPQINFDYHMYGADMGILKVEISLDQGANWTTKWTQSGNQGDMWFSDLVNLNAYGGMASVYVRFYGRVGTNYTSDMAFDNIVVDEAPTCPKPNQLTENNIDDNSVDLGWTENGSATEWDIELGTYGFSPTGTPTQSNVSTNPYTYTGLSDATKYQWYVRTACSGSNHSNWTGPHTFITLPQNDECSDAVELTVGSSVNFVTSSNLGATSSSAPWPQCAGTGTDDVWFKATVPVSGYMVVTTNDLSGSSFYDGGMEIYSGSCGNFTYVDCNDDDSPYGQDMPQIIINDLNLAGLTLYIRIWHRGDYYGDFEISAYTHPVAATWDGSEGDNDWYNEANWDINAKPGAITDVTIPANLSSYPTVVYANPQGAKCKTITIESDASGDASILGDENLTVVGSATVQRYLAGGKWHEVSAMVSGATVNSLYFNGTPNVWMKEYIESTGTRTGITSLGTSMPLGKGYEAWVETGNNATAEFQGTLNTSSISLSTSSTPPLNFTDAAHGFNLLGNPFASAIQFGTGSWSLYNVENSVWVWNPTSGNYSYYAPGSGGGSLTNGIIPLGQAFFVHTTAANPSLTIPTNARLHSNQGYYKSARNNPPPHIIVSVNMGETKDEVWVVFSDEASNGFDDGYDVLKIPGASASPQLYTVENDNFYSIDALPVIENGETHTVSLNFKAGKSGEQTLIADDIEQLIDIEVVLEDLQVGKSQILNQNPVYVFDAATYNSSERFLLHFTRSVDGIDENERNDIHAYSYDNYLYISSMENVINEHKQLSVYDIYGRKIIEKELSHDNLIKIPINISNNYIVVKIVGENSIYTTKVFIK